MTFAVWAYLIQFYAHLKFKILRIELFPITACLNGSPITQLLQPILFLSFEKFKIDNGLCFVLERNKALKECLCVV